MSQQEVFEVIRDSDRWLSSSEIAEKLGTHTSAVIKALSKVRRRKDIECNKRRGKEAFLYRYGGD